jgi:hypothetical protein
LHVTAAKEESLNIVFVPSGFNGDMAFFEHKVSSIVMDMCNQYEPLDARGVQALNYYYLKAEVPGDDGTYCQRGNPPRAITCPQAAKFQRLVQSYFGGGVHQEVVVLHNTAEYGGSGSRGFAVISWGNYASNVLAHELGHSLFGLSDEYQLEDDFEGIAGTSAVANLDGETCPKWQDLMNAGFDVSCVPEKGKGKAYFASGDTFMDWCEKPFGVANERISCCKYEHLVAWQSVPQYCQKFNQSGLNLNDFCASDAMVTVWNSSWTALFQEGAAANATREEKLMIQALDTQGREYAYVQEPKGWFLAKRGGRWSCIESDVTNLEAGIYLKHMVLGEGNGILSDTLAAEGRLEGDQAPQTRVELVVYAWSEARQTVRTLLFSPVLREEPPPRVHGEWWSGVYTDSVIELTEVNIILRKDETCMVGERR